VTNPTKVNGVKNDVLKKLKHLLKGRFSKASTDHQPNIAHGMAGISQVGHRNYVGGLWEEIGQLQFRYMIGEGLKPGHYFLDVACGSLRAGILFIPYLETGHYLGIDKEQSLIDAGINAELSQNVYEQKKPRFLVSEDFEFDKFGVKVDFALAQSLFTHLPPSLILQCLAKLRGVIAKQGAFYATFWEVDNPHKNPDKPHDHGYFAYTKEQMGDFGNSLGWTMDYIGDWRHPRGQKIVRYRPT